MTLPLRTEDRTAIEDLYRQLLARADRPKPGDIEQMQRAAEALGKSDADVERDLMQVGWKLEVQNACTGDAPEKD